MNRTILIVDDSNTERVVLKGFLKAEYDTLEAECGEDALLVLQKKHRDISAILMDVIMPGMDGFETLKQIKLNALWQSIPVIITTGLDDEEARERAISGGADNFITKPFNQKLLLHVLGNAIRLRETAAIANTLLRDNLTGLLNKDSFFTEAGRMIKRQQDGYFVLSCFNIENFKVVNDQYGSEIGDELLRYLAGCFNGFAAEHGGLACRYTADKFGVLYPARLKSSELITQWHERLSSPACLNRPIRIRVGRYLVIDRELPVSAMFDRASMAEESIKGRVDVYYAEYTEAMRDELLREQQIVNDMTDALQNGEFEPWLQPQYNHATGALVGAEALVRWRKDGKVIPPAFFIPVFEKNGFIYEVDQSVWRQVCALLRRWLDAGRSPVPVSVNISRYDLYQPDFLDVITGLVSEYDIPVGLLRLEITESAFADTANTIITVANELIARGFTVEIDDFGSGYSSLNTLKDVPASILKLDMRFFETTENSQRGGNIIESIVRMAKWINMSVIAEGVEEQAQADYLKSIGCYYIQGYFYSKPVPVDEYEALCDKTNKEPKLSRLHTLATLDNNEFWNPKSMETLIFNSYVGGACIFEYYGGKPELLRVNDQYLRELGGLIPEGAELKDSSIIPFMDDEGKATFQSVLNEAVNSKKEAVREGYLRDGDHVEYMRLTVRLIASNATRYLFYAVIVNMTEQRRAEQAALNASQRVTAIMDNSQCGITAVAMHEDGGLEHLFINQRFCETLGYTREQYLAEVTDPFGRIYPADHDRIADETMQVKDIGQTASLLFRAVRRDNRVIWLRAEVSIVRFDNVPCPVQLSNFMDITDQVEAQKKRLESAEQLKAIMGNVNGSVSAFTMDELGNTTLIFGNDRYYEIFGYTREQAEAVHLDTLSCAVPEDYDAVVAKLNKLKQDGVPVIIDYRAKKRDGSVIYIRANCSRMMMEGYGSQVIVSVEIDITEKRTLEEQLRAIIDNINGGVSATVLKADAPEYLLVNDKYYELLGYTREQFEAEVSNIFELVHPEDRERVEKLFRDAIINLKPYTMEYRIRRRNGAIRHILCNTSVMRFFGIDEPVQLAVSNDITVLRETQQKERDVSQQMQTVMANMHAGVTASVFHDRDNVEIVFSNDGFYSMYGYTKEQLSSELPNVLELIVPEDRAATMERLERIVRERSSDTCEFRCRKRDGSIVWTQVANAVISMSGVGDTVLLAICTDITALRTAERENMATADRLSTVMNAMNNGMTAVAFYGDYTRFLFANDRYYDIHGISREKYEQDRLGESLALVHPDDRAMLRRTVLSATEVGQREQAEYRVLRPDGSTRWVKVTISVTNLINVDVPVQVALYADVNAEHIAADQLRFLNDSAHDILAQPDSDAAINHILAKLVAYFRADRGYVVELNTVEMLSSNTYEVCAQGVRSERAGLQGIAYTPSDSWYKTLADNRFLIIEDVSALPQEDNKLRQMLAVQGISSIILAPLRRDGQLIGFVGADNPHDAVEQVGQLTALADYVSVLITRRDLKRKIDRDNQTVQQYINDTPGGFLRMELHKHKNPTVVSFNEGLCQMLGMTRDEAMAAYGDDAFKCLTAEDIEAMLKDAATAAAARGQFTGKCRLLCKDGSRMWTMVFGRFVEGDGGRLYLNAYFSDITAQKTAERKQIELLDNLPFGAALFEYDGASLKPVHINKQYRRLVNKDLDSSLTGFTPEDFIHPDDQALVFDEVRDAIGSRRDACCEVRLLYGEGEYRPYRLDARIRAKQNGLYMLYVAYYLITPQEQSFKAMLPRMFSTIMEFSTDLTFAKDINFRYICCSKTFAELLGMNSDKDIVGKTDYELFPKEIADLFRRDDSALFSNGEPQVDILETIPSPDGAQHYTRTTKHLLRDAVGNPIGVYCIGRDVTEIREAYAQLKLLANSIPGGLATFHCKPEDIKLTYFNDGYCQLFGYTRQEYLEHLTGALNAIFDEDRPIIDAQLKALVSNETPIDCIFRVHVKGNGYKWVTCRAAVADHVNGAVVANVVLMDITEQQQEKERLRLAEEEYRIATRHSNRTICRYDVAARTVTVAEETASRLELPVLIPDVPYGRVKLGKISKDTEQAYINFYESIMRGEKECSAVFRKHLNTGWRWIEARATTIFGIDGKPVSAIISFVDITEQREKEAVYTRWQNSLEDRPEDSYALFRCNLSRSASFDSWAGKLLNVEFDPAKQTFDERTREYVAQCVYPEDRGRYLAFMNADTMLAEYYRGHRNDSIEYRETGADGAVRWLRLTVDLVEYPNSSDVEAYLMYENIDAQKRAQLKTIERAETDPLTGVLNRATFAVRVNRLISLSKPGARHAFLMLDMDSFKLVNDVFGHGAGDQALNDIASLLTRFSRKDDLVGRLGGDEFMVFLADVTGEEDAARKARRICELTRRTFNMEVRLSVSIGIAMYPQDGESFEALYKSADETLYEVKDGGKNDYAFKHGRRVDTGLPEEDEPRQGTASSKVRRMLVADSVKDGAPIADIFKNEYRIEKAADADTALTKLRHYGSSISVVLLALAYLDTLEVLGKMQRDAELRGIPVVVIGNDGRTETALKTIRAGAAEYVARPFETDMLRFRVDIVVVKADNERVRAQSNYASLRRSDASSYQSALEHSGTLVVTVDWGKSEFHYSPSMSKRLKGNYDKRGFWQILLADGVADTQTVQQMQRLVHQVAEGRVRAEGSMNVRLKTASGVPQQFELSVFKEVNEFGIANRIVLTLEEQKG